VSLTVSAVMPLHLKTGFCRAELSRCTPRCWEPRVPAELLSWGRPSAPAGSPFKTLKLTMGLLG
jgi:hypothetical protein